MTGMNDEGRQWYVVNTYSGHENKVKENLEKRIESMGLQDVYLELKKKQMAMLKFYY